MNAHQRRLKRRYALRYYDAQTERFTAQFGAQRIKSQTVSVTVSRETLERIASNSYEAFLALLSKSLQDKIDFLDANKGKL